MGNPMNKGLVVLVGATGWLGRSIGPALLNSKSVDEGSLVCVNWSGPSSHFSPWPGVRWSREIPASAKTADVVILSLGAEEFRSGQFDCGDALVLSLMAGVGLSELQVRAGTQRVVRAMLNAAVEFGTSYTPWVTSDAAGETSKKRVRTILAVLGTEELLQKESDIDVLTALSGAGPANTALLVDALARAGAELGLDSDVALRAATSTVRDTTDFFEPEGAKPGQLVRQFIEYEGVIAAALNAAGENGFYRAISVAIVKGLEKVKTMSARNTFE